MIARRRARTRHEVGAEAAAPRIETLWLPEQRREPLELPVSPATKRLPVTVLTHARPPPGEHIEAHIWERFGLTPAFGPFYHPSAARV